MRILNYLKGSIFVLCLGFTAWLLFCFLTVSSLSEVNFQDKIEQEMFLGFLLLIFALIAFSLWEIIKYVSYKKIVLSKHLNKGIVEEAKYNVLILALSRFVVTTAIIVFALIEYVMFSQSSRFLLSSIVKLVLNKPWVFFLMFSITFGVALAVISWKDLIRSITTISNWKNRSKNWVRHLLFSVSFSVLSSSLIMFWLKTNFRAKTEEFSNEETGKLFLVIFLFFLMLPIFTALLLGHIIFRRILEDRKNAIFYYVLLHFLNVLATGPIFIWVFWAALSYSNANSYWYSTSLIANFFKLYIATLPNVVFIVVITFSFLISVISIPWKNIWSVVRKTTVQKKWNKT